jgi:uncharacterized protein (TIGR02757 family)
MVTNPLRFLEESYSRYHRREYIHPDPLEFLYRYDDIRDREIVALIASSLAYGRVLQIVKSVSAVLEIVGPRPFLFLHDATKKSLDTSFSHFKHRFSTGEELSRTLFGTKMVIEEHGSLERAFCSGLHGSHDTILGALTSFVAALNEPFHGGYNSLIPSHEKGSAMKRMNLFLRWLVRSDEIDPGGWSAVSPSRLIVPLDVHLFRIGSALGFTRRKQADIKTALEVTKAFKTISPADPVKYDFVLTRMGIRGEKEYGCLINFAGSQNGM